MDLWKENKLFNTKNETEVLSGVLIQEMQGKPDFRTIGGASAIFPVAPPHYCTQHMQHPSIKIDIKVIDICIGPIGHI